jgi:hypothetical protein
MLQLRARATFAVAVVAVPVKKPTSAICQRT